MLKSTVLVLSHTVSQWYEPGSVLYSYVDLLVELGVLVWLLVELKRTDDRAWDGTVLTLAERMFGFYKKRD